MGPCSVVGSSVEWRHRGREPPRGCFTHGLTHELGRDQGQPLKVSPDQGWFPIFSNQRSFAVVAHQGCRLGPGLTPPSNFLTRRIAAHTRDPRDWVDLW